MKRNIGLLAGLGALSLMSVESTGAKEAYKGFPSVESAKNLQENFNNPPKGYGNVPFYWWDGDSLVKERLKDQLDILGDAAIDGFSVSYIHSHPQIDVALNANGYGSFGKADPGKPGVFTDGWWDTWNWFGSRCAEKGLGLGLDDYVVGWEKNGYYVDEVLEDPSLRNYKGRLHMKKYGLKPGETLDLTLEDEPIAVVMYPSGEDLLPKKKGKELNVVNTTGKAQSVYEVTASPSYELHPDYGNRLVEYYFNRFDRHLDEEARESMNYFWFIRHFA